MNHHETKLVLSKQGRCHITTPCRIVASRKRGENKEGTQIIRGMEEERVGGVINDIGGGGSNESHKFSDTKLKTR